MSDKQQIEKQVADSMGKMQQALKQDAQKVKAEAAKAKKLVEDLKKKL